MGVKVGFLEAPKPDAPEAVTGVRTPASAVVQRDGQAVVFVLDGDDHVTRRVVRVGRTLGGDREILDGLNVGENVVLSPAPELADGDAVQPR